MDLLIAPNTVTQAQSDQAPATGTPGWATDGNPATNTPATIFPAYAFNALQAELTAAIQAAGITLDRTKLNQLASAVQKMTQGASAITAADTGVANAYAVALSPAPLAYTPGMMVVIDNIVASNTGASTLNVNGLGALPIQFPGSVALSGGEMVAGYGALLRLNHAGTSWVLLESTGAAVSPTANLGDNSVHRATTAFVQQNKLGGPLQGLQVVTSSRALGSVYTNSTGRPIEVVVMLGNTGTTGANMAFSLSINGGGAVQVASTLAGYSTATVSFIVGNGETYELTASGGGSAYVQTWLERR